jgi:uncharacterized peroxidase-related enzyme
MQKFTVHTLDTAPQASKEHMKKIQDKAGFLPNIIGEMAESPALLRGYAELNETVKTGVFSPIEQQIIQMTASFLNDCGYCMAAHSATAEKQAMPKELVEALRHDKPLKEPKHEALRQYTQLLMKKMGRVEERDIDTFVKAGWNREAALEVILHVSLKLITNYTNHLARTPLDKPFEPYKFETAKKPSDIRGTQAA